jgi:hypothetical protein
MCYWYSASDLSGGSLKHKNQLALGSDTHPSSQDYTSPAC